jgi:hypothetical protein
MALYQFRCEKGHEFERHCKIDGSDTPTRCPVCVDHDAMNCRCEARVEKLIAAPARVFPGADSWRSKNGA